MYKMSISNWLTRPLEAYFGNRGGENYTRSIEETHPGYLHSFYCKATEAIRQDDSFS